jgi:hypothetical protein
MYHTTALLYVFSIAVGGLVAAVPICSNTTDIAGGSLPNSAKPTMISASAVKDLQLALFLENLETSFFLAGLTNITQWGTNGYPNDTIEIVDKITAVSVLPSPNQSSIRLTSFSKKQSILLPLLIF